MTSHEPPTPRRLGFRPGAHRRTVVVHVKDGRLLGRVLAWIARRIAAVLRVGRALRRRVTRTRDADA